MSVCITFKYTENDVYNACWHDILRDYCGTSYVRPIINNQWHAWRTTHKFGVWYTDSPLLMKAEVPEVRVLNWSYSEPILYCTTYDSYLLSFAQSQPPMMCWICIYSFPISTLFHTLSLRLLDEGTNLLSTINGAHVIPHRVLDRWPSLRFMI